uniref:Solute carrier family 15 member 1-like n=1 Tax=Gouania willdenowi TaxID=441366 RepID=A0A8C5HU60_GOUWI
KNVKKKKVKVCGYPISIFFIVVNEFCERFSYYGMRAVLVLYFKFFLRWDDDLSTSIYHTFVALCYLTPILGAIVADSWLGKFKTIIYLSIVYAIGQVAMAVSAIHDITDTDRDGTPDNMIFHVVMSMVGLFLIALGTGGIKPCVAAFGGDQFGDHQEKQRRTFFSVFYLCINGGSLLSTIITPILRAQECGIYSQQKCYSLAFGVPAALMVVALVVFIAGSGMYYKAEPQGNIMLDVSKCIGFAIKNRYRHRSKQFPKRKHWMDWAEEKYDKLLIAQIKMVLKVLFLYIPLPVFWTLFDQKGSRWTLQATTMDGNFGLLVIQPDQMQTVNPILILTLVPIMDSVVYPLIKKCGLNFTKIEKCLLQLKILNMDSNPVTVNLPSYPPFTVPAAQVGDLFQKLCAKVALIFHNSSDESTPVHYFNLQVSEKYFTFEGEQILTEDLISKPEQGYNGIRFINGLATAVNVSSPAVDFGLIQPLNYTTYSLVQYGKTTFTLRSGSQSCEFSKEFGYGSSYAFFIPSTLVFGPTCQESITVIEEIKPNSVHMALQIPQYFFITAGEVMFSVTGLEFSYSQAPSNMKAVLQAGWLLTVAIGNFIVLIVAEAAKIPLKWAEYVLFASLLIAMCVLFSIMAYFYTYIDPTEIEAQFKTMTNEDDEKHKNGEIQMLKKGSVNQKDHFNKDKKQTRL